MRLSKFIQSVSLGTLVALIYIHLQMQIYSLAYQGKQREDRIQQLSECNSTTAYHILELKSVNHLGGRLLSQENPLRFRDQQSIIQLVTADPVATERETVVLQNPKKENSIFSMLTVKAEARPRPLDERNLFKILGQDM